mgnify:CR=1 FL=1
MSGDEGSAAEELHAAGEHAAAARDDVRGAEESVEEALRLLRHLGVKGDGDG